MSIPRPARRLSAAGVALSMIVAGSTWAEGFAEGRVVGIIHGGADHVDVYVGSPITGGPPCAQVNDRFSLDISSSRGRVAYASLLTAMHAKTAIHAHGKGSCSLDYAETLDWFVADPPLQ